MKILMLVIMFFCIAGFFIISQNNLALKDSENVDEFISLYKDWLGKTTKNLGNVAGHVIKMGWLPQ